MTWRNPQANFPCECRTPEDLVQRDNIPITFDKELNEFHLEYEELDEKGYHLIYYCPFCGGKLPGSLRGSNFAKVTKEEHIRLKSITKDIDSITSAIDKLGTPSTDTRSLSYSELSETADVYIIQIDKKNIKVQISRKHIDSSDEKT